MYSCADSNFRELETVATTNIILFKNGAASEEVPLALVIHLCTVARQFRRNVRHEERVVLCELQPMHHLPRVALRIIAGDRRNID